MYKREELENQAIERCGKLLAYDTFEYNNVECVVLSDAERCYIQGYNDAIDRAYEWIENRFAPDGSIIPTYASLMADFRKAMKGE